MQDSASDKIYQTAEERRKAGDTEEALGLFQQLLLLNPDHAEAWQRKGLCHLALGQMKDDDAQSDAWRSIEKALQLNPVFREAWLTRAMIAARLRMADETLQACKTAASLNPASSSEWYFLGRIFTDLHDYAGAVDALQHVLDIDGDNPEVLWLIGVNLDYAGQSEDALDALNASLEIDQSRAEAWCSKGVVMARLGKSPEEVLEPLEKALALKPDLKQAIAFSTTARDMIERRNQGDASIPFPPGTGPATRSKIEFKLDLNFPPTDPPAEDPAPPDKPQAG